MSSGFFRGTNTEQDSRWGDAEKKLLRRTKFSKVLEQKVNMKKVNMDVMQRWITQRITSLLGFEDDIVVGTCVNYLSEEGNLDPKKLQLQLTGFLEKSTSMFMEELWVLLIDAQNSIGGIPSAFLQDKKEEILRAKEQERKREVELQHKLAAHDEEMESATSSITRDMITKIEAKVEASRPPESLAGPKPAEGRRASRWGNSAAVIALNNPMTMPTADTGSDEVGHANTPVGLNQAISSRDPADRSVDGDSSKLPHDIGDHSGERDDSPEKSRKNYRSRRESKDETSVKEKEKEKKRKSKSKHGKKSHRKKSKKEHRSGEDRGHRSGEDRGHRRAGKSGKDYSDTPGREHGDGSSSSEYEGDTSTNDVEEALRLKVIASVESRKSRRTQGDT